MRDKPTGESESMLGKEERRFNLSKLPDSLEDRLGALETASRELSSEANDQALIENHVAALIDSILSDKVPSGDKDKLMGLLTGMRDLPEISERLADKIAEAMNQIGSK
ncbi:MAG: hypothetical protein COT81_00105 [Candidatus Buchananbacteria bacterium CG10_big_fil_rev_8_21_14_0_10_42_9]|uniref:Uncharacterized protein n=1 Tax=Candidatus Buchananbacteria bacterium CG10_big_fil_rev_8_21_14_0_10_42_9 TaxID=1974526 RepID=A0A2H0W2R4_9BACT|nr:MAG: hypothetical protein COT81_00105 [Candidatus Buchananbacteria bacterium CG10_big_fil_rev_8_21_14_0_10_42_9]